MRLYIKLGSFLVFSLFIISMAFASTKVTAKSAAIVTKLTGNATVSPGGKIKLKRIIKVGDRLTTSANTNIELTFSDGTKLRIGANSDIVLVKNTKQTPANKPNTFIKLGKGKVWGKVPGGKRKLVTQGSTAVCAVMGTTFRMDTAPDATNAGVYDGSVGIRLPVGDLSEENIDQTMESIPNLSKTIEPSAPPKFGPPTEIPPPIKAIPGPQEVSMTQWLQIVENQQIVIGKDSQAVVSEIDSKGENKDDWIKWNKELDKQPLQPITIQDE